LPAFLEAGGFAAFIHTAVRDAVMGKLERSNLPAELLEKVKAALAGW
jgi:hypothetical protein